MKYQIALVALLFHQILIYGQDFPPTSGYPSGYFRNPLDVPIKLAANFGELRANHYHMGLDIRTQQKENLPVRAAADGYVAKVSIDPAGFGQAIYIRHPNGYTTLYAHLNKFFPALATYVSSWQYRQQTWQGAIDIPAGTFPVKKGDLIAYSGNTGGSQGPHLHFEIRRSSDETNLNPLLFGLPVPDNVAPVILRLAVYDRSLSTYEQSPGMRPVVRASAVGGTYGLHDSVLVVTASRVSFAISCFDSQSGSTNPNGVYQSAIYQDDRLLSAFQMNNISYSDTRKINAHIDYRTRESGGPWLQHLSRLPGHRPPCIYQQAAASADPVTGIGGQMDGIADVSDGLPHVMRITVKDAAGNTAVLQFRVQYRPSPVSTFVSAPMPGKVFHPGMLDTYEGDGVAFYIGEKALYDSVHIDVRTMDAPAGGASPVYVIGSKLIPLQEPVLVRLKCGLPGSKERVVMVRTEGAKKEAQQPEWLGDWASGRWRSLGEFRLVEDKTPPVITPVGIKEGAILTKARTIAFRVKDDMGGIRSFRAVLDPAPDGQGGQWLCFTNDKYLAHIYTFEAHCPKGKHLLRVTVEDVAGNRTVKEYHFTR